MLVLAMPCLCDGTETHPLWQDPFYVIMPTNHPFGALESVPVERLSEYNMVMMEDGHCLREQTLAICRQSPSRSGSEGESEPTFTAMSLHSMAEMVELGLGIAIMPALAIENGILKNRAILARPLAGGLRGAPSAWPGAPAPPVLRILPRWPAHCAPLPPTQPEERTRSQASGPLAGPKNVKSARKTRDKCGQY